MKVEMSWTWVGFEGLPYKNGRLGVICTSESRTKTKLTLKKMKN
jgi:hypothetical protein